MRLGQNTVQVSGQGECTGSVTFNFSQYDCPQVNITSVTRNGNIQVNWTYPFYPNNSNVRGYEVRWRAANQNNWPPNNFQTINNPITLLTSFPFPIGTVEVQVRAICNNNTWGAWSQSRFGGRIGVSEAKSNPFDWSLYPNPTQGTLNIRLEGISEQEASELVLYDLTGKEVWRKSLFLIESEAKELDLSSLSAGVYTLRLTNGSALKTAKVIIE